MQILEEALNNLCAKRPMVLARARKQLAALPSDESLKEAVTAATARYEEVKQ